MDVLNIIPDAERMARVFAQATAPAFFLGACVALGALLMTRLTDVMGRLRSPRTGQTERQSHALLRRARLLHSAIGFALAGALCTTVLLVIAFIGSLLRWHHEFGAAALFLGASLFIGCALFRFAQEVRVGLVELEEYL